MLRDLNVLIEAAEIVGTAGTVETAEIAGIADLEVIATETEVQDQMAGKKAKTKQLTGYTD